LTGDRSSRGPGSRSTGRSRSRASRRPSPTGCGGFWRSTKTTPTFSVPCATTRCWGAPLARLRGLRPLRVATVAQALLRAFCGQLIEAKRARRLEQTIIRTICAEGPEHLHVAPATADLAALAPSQLRALGLHAGRGASLVRLCRTIELERFHDVETDVVAARLGRERGLGPWSIGVVCLEGLGRYDCGLVGDLGLVKLLRDLRGRPVEGWETAELLEPYGEWAGIASMYLLAGYSRGLLAA